ncbi:hypothetical protein ACJX0J_010198, partial [Zea mays]
MSCIGHFGYIGIENDISWYPICTCLFLLWFGVYLEGFSLAAAPWFSFISNASSGMGDLKKSLKCTNHSKLNMLVFNIELNILVVYVPLTSSFHEHQSLGFNLSPTQKDTTKKLLWPADTVTLDAANNEWFYMAKMKGVELVITRQKISEI